MSKLKILVPLVLVILAAIGGYYLLNQQLDAGGQVNGEQAVTSCQILDEMSWCQFEEQNEVKSLNLVIFDKPFDIKFTAKDAQSVKDQALLSGYSVAINGSYYRNSPVSAEHAGLLQLKGELVEPLVDDPDNQLTHVAVYDAELDMLNFVPVNGFDRAQYKDANYTLFQSGPMLIDDNQVQTAEIAASLNGDSKYLRTIIGVTDKGEKFIGVTRLEFTLTDLADLLLNLDIFKGKRITVLNLDGGSSTAMYSRDLSQFNWWSSKRLPIIIGVE